jgi:Protein of unknown function (DUF1236)
MKRAWWLIGGAFVVVVLVAAIQYQRTDTPQPIGERIDQPASESLAAPPAKPSEDVQPDTSTTAARLDEPSDEARAPAQEITDPAPAALTPEQREQIRGRIAGPRETRVDTSEFRPTIGTIVPAHVLLHRLPTELADIMGGYHGSYYLIVIDRLVIVDPKVRRIVAVFPGV